jgi:hypothetical protein
MGDYSEIKDFSKISDCKVDETHSKSECKFSVHSLNVFDEIYNEEFRVYIWYRECHCTPQNDTYVLDLKWDKILRGEVKGIIVHGKRHCRIHRRQLFGDQWQFREECHCNTRRE